MSQAFHTFRSLATDRAKAAAEFDQARRDTRAAASVQGGEGAVGGLAGEIRWLPGVAASEAGAASFLERESFKHRPQPCGIMFRGVTHLYPAGWGIGPVAEGYVIGGWHCVG